jgi:hypothetical protein
MTSSALKKRSSSPLRVAKEINMVKMLKQYMGIALAAVISERRVVAMEVAVVWRAVASAE